MFQTGYKSINPFSRKLPYEGGFCKWYHTPIENIVSWPTVAPVTQYLTGEPTLAEGKTWLGPIKVPNSSIGFEEVWKQTPAGPICSQQVTGNHIGDSGATRVNMMNMLFHEYAIAGQLRAGGMWLLLGHPTGGLQFKNSFKSSTTNETGREFIFETQTLEQSFILTSFLGIDVTPPQDYVIGTGGGIFIDSGNKVEIIEFTTEPQIEIELTPERIANFGLFPMVQVWSTEGHLVTLLNVSIEANARPPALSTLKVYTPGTETAEGFIVIK